MPRDFQVRPGNFQVDLKNAQVPRVYEIIHSGDVFRFLHREVPFRTEDLQVDLNAPSA